MRSIHETDIDQKGFLGEFICECGEVFLGEIRDKNKLESGDASVLVNMVLSPNEFPLARCPKCGALEVF